MAFSKPPALSDDNMADRLDFPYLKDLSTITFLNGHGRLLFIIRGPPGTGKDDLKNLLKHRYEGAEIVSADVKLDSPLTTDAAKKSLIESHDQSYRKHEELMEKGIPILINRNTNGQAVIIGKYLSLAAKYGYTVILSETTEKFSTDPKVLAMTNSRNLDEEYFKKRLKHWEYHIYPVYFGWFLNPADAFVLQKICRLFLDRINLTGSFKPLKYPVFAIAEHCDYGRKSVTKAYAESREVKDSLGSCHSLAVFGFAITGGVVFALVSVKGQENLFGENLFPKSCEPDGELSNQTKVTSNNLLVDPSPAETCDANFHDMVKYSKQTLVLSTSNFQIPDKNSVTFIPLGSVETPSEDVMKNPLGNLWKKVCNIFLTDDNEVKITGTEHKTVKVYAHRGSWLFLSKDRFLVKSVFTGFYQKYQLKRSRPCYNYKIGKCKWGETCVYLHL